MNIFGPFKTWNCWVFCGLLFLYAGCRSSSIERPLNVILITVDDLGWVDLGCYGSTYYETPHIDDLALSSIRFTQAYAAAAVCSPTRAALMTGKYPARLGITDWIRAEFQGGGVENPTGYDTLKGKSLYTPKNPFHLPLEETTIAEVLRQNGYVTAHIGKWHLGTDEYYPDKQGFDYNLGGCDYGQPPGYFDPYIYVSPANGGDTLSGFPGLPPRQDGEYLTDREASEAVTFITQNKDKPFFLNMSHYAVHTPIQAKEELINKYDNKFNKQGAPAYAAMIQSVDEAVGNVLQNLDDLDLREQTVILFTSDNGGLKGPRYTDNTPLRSGKGYPFEGGIRVPLIISHPAVTNQKVCDTPVISCDLFPTILNISGNADMHHDGLDGVNLMPLIYGQDSLSRDRLVWHFPHYRGKDVTPYSILRSKDWKLIKYYGRTAKYDLFDLKKDLAEKNNLAPDLPERVKDLDLILSGELERLNAQLPILIEPNKTSIL